MTILLNRFANGYHVFEIREPVPRPLATAAEPCCARLVRTCQLPQGHVGEHRYWLGTQEKKP